jgi:hypothetical protein
MSTRELRRAEVLGRVKSKTLQLTDAAKILELSYRQTKRLWKRYRGEGAKGLCGKRFEPREAGRVPAEGSAADPEEVFGNGAGAIWTDAGSGALSG